MTTQLAAGARKPANLNSTVSDNTTVRTESGSRIELVFADQSIARLWECTILDVKDGRNLFLHDGAIFVDVPPAGEGVSVRGEDVAVDISDTSALFEYHSKVFKLLVLKGTARLYRPDHLGDSVLVNAGQLVFGNPKAALSDPVDFDIKHFLNTSRFLGKFGPLRNQAVIVTEVQKQEIEKSKKVLMETNLVMYGGGTTVSAIGGPPGKNSPNPGSTRGPGP